MIHKALFSLLFIFMSVVVISAQSQFKAIVLINGGPYLVDLGQNGTIFKRYQKVTNYFVSSAADKEIIDQLSSQGLVESGDISFYDNSSESYTSPARKVDGVTVIRDKQFISFSLKRAVLNQEAVDQVRTIADAFQSEKFNIVTINSFHHDTPPSITLARNRAKAITDLLHTFGVSLDAIEVNLSYASEDSEISFVNLAFR